MLRTRLLSQSQGAYCSGQRRINNIVKLPNARPERLHPLGKMLQVLLNTGKKGPDQLLISRSQLLQETKMGHQCRAHRRIIIESNRIILTYLLDDRMDHRIVDMADPWIQVMLYLKIQSAGKPADNLIRGCKIRG